MAPTLIDLDGYAHQTIAVTQAGSGFIGTYDGSVGSGVTFDTVNKRLPLHVAALKIVEDGVSATSVVRTVATQMLVLSFYFRTTAAPGQASHLLFFANTQAACDIQMATTGALQLEIGNSSQTSKGTYADGKWHRVDIKWDATGTTYTGDWYIDGVAQTQVTKGSLTANNFTNVRMGSTTATDNLTYWLSDLAVSATSGDFPIGPHACLPLYIAGDGTHTLGTTNAIQNDAGGSSNLYQAIDEWNGGLPNTTDYITYVSTTLGDAASNFAEFTLATVPSRYTVWDVKGYIAGFCTSTGADTADIQILTGHGGTLIDHLGNLIDYSGSTSVLGYYQSKLARISGGWTPSNLSSSVVQWGRSTDTNGQPRLSAIMFEIAIAAPPREVLGHFSLGAVR